MEIRDSERGFEAIIDGQVAGFIDVVDDGATLTLPHTVTEPAFGGRGVGSALVRRAIEQARTTGRAVRPTCSFAAAWIAKHPDDVAGIEVLE